MLWPALLTAALNTSQVSAAEAWPELPAANGAIEIPAQQWAQRKGARTVKILIHYPGGRLSRLDERTGIMLSLHNWGGIDCVATADPQPLADRLNVVGICVNYLQSGPQDSIEGPEPYDCGYLQSLDALRALWFVRSRLQEQRIPFASGRLFATGGSGGGNVALMANKLAPRTFACIVDVCGMKKLSADIAFHLPGGSDLDARWSRHPDSPSYLTADEQDLRFVGHPDHLQTMKRLGTSSRIIIVHGADDATCPFADAEELVANLQAAGMVVEPHFITKRDVDGRVFTSSGHALGNRTEIVFRVAEKYLTAAGSESLTRPGPTDFDLRDEEVRYQTPGGEFIISYAAGYPVGRFDPAAQPPEYAEHQDLSYYLDAAGKRQPITTADDWQVRRAHIVAHLQRVTGRLPGESFRVPLAVQVLEERRIGKLICRKLSFQSDPFDRVPAWLFLPAAPAAERLPAALCLHQTTPAGKDEPAGFAGNPHMFYARELAERGYVTLAPDYPSLGEHAYDFSQHPEFASGTLKAVWDNRRAVDLLQSLAEVDPERIGVIGHSLGGHNALFTAAFEPRLKVIVSSCGFSTFTKDDVPSWTGPRYMPRIASQFGSDAGQVPFDFAEILGAAAPRPVLVSACTRDDDFDVGGVRNAIKAARPVYLLLEKRDHLAALYPDAPHDFPAEARRQAYEFLDKHLNHRGSPLKR